IHHQTTMATAKNSLLSAIPKCISKLDMKCWENETEHVLLEKLFGKRIVNPKIYQNQLFAPVLINSIITGVRYSPQCTMWWIVFPLLNLRNKNRIDLTEWLEEFPKILEPYLRLEEFVSVMKKGVKWTYFNYESYI